MLTKRMKIWAIGALLGLAVLMVAGFVPRMISGSNSEHSCHAAFTTANEDSVSACITELQTTMDAVKAVVDDAEGLSDETVTALNEAFEDAGALLQRAQSEIDEGTFMPSDFEDDIYILSSEVFAVAMKLAQEDPEAVAGLREALIETLGEDVRRFGGFGNSHRFNKHGYDYMKKSLSAEALDAKEAHLDSAAAALAEIEDLPDEVRTDLEDIITDMKAVVADIRADLDNEEFDFPAYVVQGQALKDRLEEALAGLDEETKKAVFSSLGRTEHKGRWGGKGFGRSDFWKHFRHFDEKERDGEDGIRDSYEGYFEDYDEQYLNDNIATTLIEPRSQHTSSHTDIEDEDDYKGGCGSDPYLSGVHSRS